MKLHLVDGTFELFRAYYSKAPDAIAADGKPVKATAGLVRSLISLLHDQTEEVTHIAFAFDNPIESFRNALFAGYKTGYGMPPDLYDNFDLAEEAVAALGVTVWRMDEWEADDALATGAHRWSNQVDQVRLLTPDKDLTQCVRGDKVVTVDRIRRKVLDEQGVVEKFGVEPSSIPDYLALVGDSADGIPGLAGWGAKSTAKVVAAYESLDAIPLDSTAWSVKVRSASRLAETLHEQLDDALLYRTLARLRTDVPLAESLDDLRFVAPAPGVLDSWCDYLGIRLNDTPPRFRV